MHKGNIVVVSLLFLFTLTCCHKEPTACFDPESSSIDKGYDSKVEEEVTMNNCSVEATHYEWDFGDGTTSRQINPVHSYKAGGNYTVSLKAIGNGGDQFISKEITILSLDGNWEGAFTIGTTTFLFNLNLKQEEKEVNGSFELDDNSTSSNLESSGIDGVDLALKFKIYFSTTTYLFKFKGKTNSAYDHMSGDLLINDEKQGTWSANRYTSKNAKIKGNYSDNNSVEEIINLIHFKN